LTTILVLNPMSDIRLDFHQFLPSCGFHLSK
jgi:hypothetical protein